MCEPTLNAAIHEQLKLMRRSDVHSSQRQNRVRGSSTFATTTGAAAAMRAAPGARRLPATNSQSPPTSITAAVTPYAWCSVKAAASRQRAPIEVLLQVL